MTIRIGWCTAVQCKFFPDNVCLELHAELLMWQHNLVAVAHCPVGRYAVLSASPRFMTMQHTCRVDSPRWLSREQYTSYSASAPPQVVQEVFCWTRNPMEVRRLCSRKEELYSKLIGNHHPPVVPGVPLFLDTLVKHNVRSLVQSLRLP